MKTIKQAIRLLHINFILAKHGLDQIILSLHLFAPLRFIIYFNPWNWWRRNALTRGEAIRLTFEQLGPIFVKFGQALSTRPDIIPTDIVIELAKLQDQVPPIPNTIAMQIIETAFKQPLNTLFASVNPDALASASVAQVHAATLLDGREVVIKILRPNVRKAIEQDLSILKTIAHLADRYWSESKRFKPKEILREFEQHILDELDLQREAANGSQLRRNFAQSPLLYIPEIHWDYTHSDVMVMERIYGIPITNMNELHHHRINIKKLAERGLEIFFTQVFRDCFFHADMHPGNIFVSPVHAENPQYICVDFGIIGTLNDTDKRYLAENLIAFFNRDYRRIAELHVQSGWVDRATAVGSFENAIRTVCEPIFERPLKDISFAILILRLFQVAQRFNMQVQPQLLLLQKTLLAVEGMGRQLYPELDLWVTAKPFLEKWLREQLGPKAFLKHIRNNLPFVVEQLPYLPSLMHEVLMLKKQQLQQLSSTNTVEQSTSRRTFLKGAGLGIILTAAFFGCLHYTHNNWIFG